ALEALREQRAVGDLPAGRAAAAEVAVCLQRAVDAACRVVAEARRIEARQLEIGGESEGLPEVDTPAAGRLAVTRSGVERAHLDLLPLALGIRGEAHVLLRQRSFDALAPGRELERERSGETRLPQARIQAAQIEIRDAHLKGLPLGARAAFA